MKRLLLLVAILCLCTGAAIIRVPHTPAPRDTTNKATGGTATASSELNSNLASYAFDQNPGTVWQATGASGWIKYDFGAGITHAIQRYSINPYSDATYGPKSWTVEGSNDDSGWTTLDTQTDVTTGWTGGVPRYFSFTNATAYRYIRMSISATNGGAYITIYEITYHKY